MVAPVAGAAAAAGGGGLGVGSAILAGAGIGAIGSYMGAQVSARNAKKMLARQLDEQRMFAQHGLQWRVSDAISAGVHPLYALGAQLPQFSPVAIQTDDLGRGIAEATGRIGEGIAQYGVEKMREWEAGEQRRYLEDELRARRLVLGAQAADFEASAAESRSRTLLNVLQLNKERRALEGGLTGDAVERVVPEVFGTGGGGMATNVPDQAWKPFDMGGGFMMDWPSGKQPGLASAMEGVEGFLPASLVIGHNVKKYGLSWIGQALKNQDDFARAHGEATRRWIVNGIRAFFGRGR